jgi:hypothetical protein
MGQEKGQFKTSASTTKITKSGRQRKMVSGTMAASGCI